MLKCITAAKVPAPVRYINGRAASDSRCTEAPLMTQADIGRARWFEESLASKVLGCAVVFWTQFLYPNEMAGDDL